MREIGLFGGVWIVIFGLSASGGAAAATLPPEVLYDKHLADAERKLAADDPEGAADAFAALVTLDVEVPEEIWLRYGETALLADRPDEAADALTRYLAMTERGTEPYHRAIGLLLDAEDRLEPERSKTGEPEPSTADDEKAALPPQALAGDPADRSFVPLPPSPERERQRERYRLESLAHDVVLFGWNVTGGVGWFVPHLSFAVAVTALTAAAIALAPALTLPVLFFSALASVPFAATFPLPVIGLFSSLAGAEHLRQSPLRNAIPARVCHGCAFYSLFPLLQLEVGFVNSFLRTVFDGLFWDGPLPPVAGASSGVSRAGADVMPY